MFILFYSFAGFLLVFQWLGWWNLHNLLPPEEFYCFVFHQNTDRNIRDYFLLLGKKHNILLPAAAAAAAKLLQSCLTLCDPIDGSPPGSPIPGILQARTLEWVAISFTNAWKWKVKVKLLSRVRLCAIPWTAAYQAPPSMGFSRQEYWSGVPLPSLILLPRYSELPQLFKCVDKMEGSLWSSRTFM